ncbi:MAG: D-2-hydroxyacid dehydrogenase [Prevotella sp.]|jgi:glycerate dehydrogenase|nr:MULTISPECIES: D-2-hydroxyacid dehydrogenase [unclassified Prevotella]MCH3969207.1 D-2-hydroxyacid dehydrogenase [Prevotella sp.]MCH3985771.1 D-2-hydroxyacid dehydrogenase [Prevotella sp.]MCH4017487.1 D-2-hydroxyacid dehydrogenase [Prevotella sp.]MCH4185240.1 D-2-hydroxyacid dehydrogenase [Prevotella sp.]MCH4215276.1 D-2-hydroxyacid dehydrogenase [Prevotella sp.]
MKIVELDGYAVNPGDLSWDELKEMGEMVIYDRSAPGQVVERAKDAELIMTNKVQITDQVMSQLPKLRYIGIMATGINVVDIVAARKRGIIVTNIPSYSTDSVAQMVFAHILNITNQVDHYANLNRKGRWSHNQDFCYWDSPIIELANKTIGIVGLGHIGTEVAKIARDFGMDVFAYTSRNATDLPAGIQKTSLDGLFGVSDILSLHCPLTPGTREMINKESLKKMKRGAILINTGRGPLVNEQDVADALKSGQLGAYGADVMVSEPPSADNPLFLQPHAYLTPHIAWASKEARMRLMKICVDNVRAFLAGHPVHVVNQ